MSKLALGTVQFGIPYGISNARGQVPLDEVSKMLRLAAASGVDVLDTAQAYGTSERVLGEVLSSTGLEFKIVTKLKCAAGKETVSITPSLKNLRRPNVYAVMLHSFEEYCLAPEIYDELLRARDAGQVSRIGFSVYSPEQVLKLIADRVPFDILQFPYNIFDRRFDELMPELKEKGVEIHVRSIFLQGLLLMDPANLAPYFDSVRGKISALRSAASAVGISMPKLCLAAAKANMCIDQVVMGVTSIGELETNLRDFDCVSMPEGKLSDEIEKCRVDDINVINPALWKTS